MFLKVNFYDHFLGEWRTENITLSKNTTLHKKGDDKVIGYNRFVDVVNKTISSKFLRGEYPMFLGEVTLM